MGLTTPRLCCPVCALLLWYYFVAFWLWASTPKLRVLVVVASQLSLLVKHKELPPRSGEAGEGAGAGLLCGAFFIFIFFLFFFDCSAVGNPPPLSARLCSFHSRNGSAYVCPVLDHQQGEKRYFRCHRCGALPPFPPLPPASAAIAVGPLVFVVVITITTVNPATTTVIETTGMIVPKRRRGRCRRWLPAAAAAASTTIISLSRYRRRRPSRKPCGSSKVNRIQSGPHTGATSRESCAGSGSGRGVAKAPN
mmetsp:Transcript_472/g.1059  ORF Transcript_472/g.1059 Transcript_472/m.1059 type:complete len:251 (+) Transcript_472:200-952(+)